ncbi:unnamed protein product [Amoebophrya sp. A120]|nr:unnamed protein product [Amoebophrya sp. A120]|eukprot:GSA120T00006482001.1
MPSLSSQCDETTRLYIGKKTLTLPPSIEAIRPNTTPILVGYGTMLGRYCVAGSSQFLRRASTATGPLVTSCTAPSAASCFQLNTKTSPLLRSLSSLFSRQQIVNFHHGSCPPRAAADGTTRQSQRVPCDKKSSASQLLPSNIQDLADEAKRLSEEDPARASFVVTDMARDSVQGACVRMNGVMLILFLMLSEGLLLLFFFNCWWWQCCSNSWLRGGII